jgi:hypothetical protein
MNRYSLTHVPDSSLLRDLRSLLGRERATTAELLAHLAEVDARKLYAPAGYPSMFAWCVEGLRLPKDAAYKRIQAARTARRFPAIFSAVADGRLNRSGVVLLAPYLGEANADEMLAAAAGRTRAGIEEWLARRFPRSELLPLVTQLPAVQRPDDPLAPGRAKLDDAQLAPGQVETDDRNADDQLAPKRAAASATRARLMPAAPERYALQVTIGKGTYDKLRHAQALLGRQVPSGEVAEVLDRALDALIARLEQRKCAATSRPRPCHQSSANPRHVPAEVRRSVWQRDGGRCTFVSAAGHRCEAARRAAEETRARATAEADEARAHVAAVEEVVPWLRALGLRMDEARRRAAACAALPDASLEERVRHALRCSGRPSRACAALTPQPAP